MNKQKQDSPPRALYIPPMVMGEFYLSNTLSLLASMSIQGDADGYGEGGDYEGVISDGDL